MTRQIVNASKGVRFLDATDEKIREVLGKGILLLGIPTNKIPSELEQMVLIEFLKSQFHNFAVNELSQAFIYAAAKKLDINVKLYGGTFSAEYIGEIIKAYRKLKTPIINKIESDEVKENNNQITSTIVKALGEDGIKKVNEKADRIEKEKTDKRAKLREELKKIKLPNEDQIQVFFIEFDKLHKDQENQSRHVKYKGKMLDVSEFVDFRLQEENNKLKEDIK